MKRRVWIKIVSCLLLVSLLAGGETVLYVGAEAETWPQETSVRPVSMTILFTSGLFCIFPALSSPGKKPGKPIFPCASGWLVKWGTTSCVRRRHMNPEPRLFSRI